MVTINGLQTYLNIVLFAATPPAIDCRHQAKAAATWYNTTINGLQTYLNIVLFAATPALGCRHQAKAAATWYNTTTLKSLLLKKINKIIHQTQHPTKDTNKTA